MSWIELTIRTVSDGIELLCTELTQAGFDSFVIDDQTEFQAFLERAKDYWDYVDDALRARMQGVSQVRLYLPAEGAQHASTQMCMRALEQLVHGGERVADLGSGSGILSICALRLGAQSAVGVDVDPAAEHIARENAARNGFGPERFSACTGNVVTDAALMARLGESGGYDIVCANIVAGVIVQLVPVVPKLLKAGGVFLCSGILAEREGEVRQAIEAAGLRVVAAGHTDEWCCLLAQ